MPGARNVLGTSPSPARVNLGNTLYQFPGGTSGLELSQSCNASKSATEIRPSRKRSTRCFMKYGGGFLIFGILVLSAEHDPLKLRGQAAEFVFAFGLLNALQTKVKSPLRSVSGRGSRFSLIDVFAYPVEFLDTRVWLLRRDTDAALFGLRPPRLNGLPRAFASLFGGEFGGSGETALFPAFPPQGYGGRILLCVYGHALYYT